MSLKNGILTISLDFELHWGRFDKYPLTDNEGYYLRTRTAVPRILDLFEMHHVHATWATVGGLMADNLEEWLHYGASEQPSYSEQKYSAYSWVKSQKQILPEALFAPELVRQLIACPGQELGSHTYSHYYTCEMGQQHAQFSADLKAAKRIAKEKFGQVPVSLVFPRNQYDANAILVAGTEGFSALRSNPRDWFWQHTEDESFVKRIFRTGDTLISLGMQTQYPLEAIIPETPTLLPASRLLRPFKGDYILHRRRISRIKDEMLEAAKTNQVYHLWWHPHNFGEFTDENLMGLRQILEWLEVLRKEHGMQSLHMAETASAALGVSR